MPLESVYLTLSLIFSCVLYCSQQLVAFTTRGKRSLVVHSVWMDGYANGINLTGGFFSHSTTPY